MNTISIPLQTIPVAAEVDLCVCGGSCTGVFAAIAAARKGLRVALVEANGFFGGSATASFVPVWHSLYSLDGTRQIIGGLTEETLHRLDARHDVQFRAKTDPSVYATFSTPGLILVLDQMVAQEAPRLRPFLHATVSGSIVRSPGELSHVIIQDKSGTRAIAARFFIDATGDGDLLRRSGFSMRSVPDAERQAHTTCAILAGADRLSAAHPDFSFGEMMKPERGAGLKHVFFWQAPVIGAPGLSFVALSRVSCNPVDADQLTAAEMEGRRQINAFTTACNREFPTPDARIAVAALPPSIGLRESLHANCLYTLTEQDLLHGKTFPDTIARGTYRIDIHEGSGITFRYLDGTSSHLSVDPVTQKTAWTGGRWLPDGAPHAQWYEIPFRSIVPARSVNVLCAGRMLDCDRGAYGAVRVMVTCNQMGEAAGSAAADILLSGQTLSDYVDALSNPKPGTK